MQRAERDVSCRRCVGASGLPGTKERRLHIFSSEMSAIDAATIQGLMDKDGRIVASVDLRKSIFRSGCCAAGTVPKFETEYST